ncbi:MAG TPA: hypothetical protein VJ717_09250 [Gemmatimonadaceae bacterium]|nr:hypothetical protein [Gemmatimonadaceae bacterium]
MRVLFALTLAAGALGVNGCGGARQGPRGSDPATMLQVDNQSFLDMNIYLITSGGARIRMGTAGGNSTTNLRIPATYIFGGSELRFQADPIGSNRQPVSQSITVFPGDTVRLIIPPGT